MIMSMADGTEDYLSMSDEDFAKINGPAVSTEGEPQDKTPEASTVEADADTTKTENTTTTENSDKSEDKAEEKSEDKVDNNVSDTTADDADKSKSEEKSEDKGKEKPADKSEEDKSKDASEAEKAKDAKATDAKPEDKETSKGAEEAKPVDYKDFHDKIIGVPFKANGKEIIVKNADEAIRLMQQGAGFMRKIQNIQPHLKTVKMLEKENLLNPDDISYLIDLKNKNPAAIKKLIKESGIDPLDLNTDDKVDYKPTNRTISDSEMAFSDALDDLKLHPQGVVTIKEINDSWDAPSKQVLFKNPGLLKVIQEQKDNGVYAVITSEIDRQKTLGTLDRNKPFLEAYREVGDHLQSTGGFNHLAQQQQTQKQADPAATPAKTLIETKAAPTKSEVDNNDKAKAASPSKSSSKSASIKINPLEMPDEEFMKQFNGRL